MAWFNLAEDLEEEFSGLQAWDYGPPESLRAPRRSPPPDKRLADLERQATALLRAAEPRRAKPPVPWTPERAERQRQRRQEARGPAPRALASCGPYGATARAREALARWAEEQRARDEEERQARRARDVALEKVLEAKRRARRKSLQARTG